MKTFSDKTIKVISATIISIVALFLIFILFIVIFVHLNTEDHPNHKRELVFSEPVGDGWTQLGCAFRVNGMHWPRHRETWTFSINIEDRITSLSEMFIVSRFVLSEDGQLGGILELDLKELTCINDPNCDETYRLRLHLRKKTGKNLELRGEIEDKFYYAGIGPRISGECKPLNGSEHIYRDVVR